MITGCARSTTFRPPGKIECSAGSLELRIRVGVSPANPVIVCGHRTSQPTALLGVVTVLAVLGDAVLARQGVRLAIQSRDIIAQAVIIGVVQTRYLERLLDAAGQFAGLLTRHPESRPGLKTFLARHAPASFATCRYARPTRTTGSARSSTRPACPRASNPQETRSWHSGHTPTASPPPAAFPDRAPAGVC